MTGRRLPAVAGVVLAAALAALTGCSGRTETVAAVSGATTSVAVPSGSPSRAELTITWVTAPVEIDGSARLLPVPASFDRSSVTVSSVLALVAKGTSASELRKRGGEVTLWVGVTSGVTGGLPDGLVVGYLRLADGPMCLAGGMFGGPTPEPTPCNRGSVAELAAPHRGFQEDGVL